MTCVLLWAGPTYAGALLLVPGVCHEENQVKRAAALHQPVFRCVVAHLLLAAL